MIDAALYPDVDPPAALETDEQRADFIVRVCSTWDFGTPPHEETVAHLSVMRTVFDAYPLPHSIAYHTLRSLFGWPALPASVNEADYERYDRARSRDADRTLI